jgi:hypothetical protein
MVVLLVAVAIRDGNRRATVIGSPRNRNYVGGKLSTDSTVGQSRAHNEDMVTRKEVLYLIELVRCSITLQM